jgi:Flp pilus assembly secretin CpaC
MGRTTMGQEKLLAGLRACVLGLAMLFMPLSASRAGDETVALALGTGSVVRLDRSFATVLIADPYVVEVRVQDDRSVILQPRTVGATVIVFVDEQSIVIANIRVVVRDAQT